MLSCFPWGQYQAAAPTETDISNWQQQHRPSGWAVVTGKVSGRITLDFDGVSGCETLKQLNLNPHRKTPSGGYHVDFRHPGWPVKTVNSKSKTELGRRWPGLDIRADGGYALFCGKTDKGEYVWLRESHPEELSILPNDLREFLGLLRPPAVNPVRVPLPRPEYHDSTRVSSHKLVERAVERIAADGRNNAGFWLAQQLRDNGYSQSEAESVMQEFHFRCPPTDMKGQREPYTEHEMRASLRKAYEVSPRELWGPSRSGCVARI